MQLFMGAVFSIFINKIVWPFDPVLICEYM